MNDDSDKRQTTTERQQQQHPAMESKRCDAAPSGSGSGYKQHTNKHTNTHAICHWNFTIIYRVFLAKQKQKIARAGRERERFSE